MRSLVLGSLLFFGMSAAWADTHLYPLNLGISYLRNAAGKKWLDTIGKDDRILVEFDVFPAFNPPSFLGVIDSPKADTYTIYYFEDSYDQDKVRRYKAPVPAKFGEALADQLETLIRTDTHFDKDGSHHLEPLDAGEFFVRSRLVAATAYNGREGGVPKQLIAVFAEVKELANTPATDENKRQALMDGILKDMDAIQLPEQP